MTAMLRPPRSVLAALFALSGCAPTASTETDATWIVVEEPTVRIGVVEGDSAYQFQSIRTARFMSDGRIVIADDGLAVLRIYAPDGLFQSQVGRRGDGPGEFQGIRALWVSEGDTIGVWDSGSQRLTYFDGSGELARTAPVTPSSDTPGGGTLDVLVGAFSDGSVALARVAAGHRGSGVPVPDRMAIERFDATGSFLGTLGEVTGLVRFGPAPLPFSPFPYFAVRDDAVLFTNGSTPELTLLPEGTGPAVPIPVHDRVAESVDPWDALEAELVARGSEMQLGLLDDMPRDAPLPHVAGLLVDSDGNSWTKPYVPSVDALWLSTGARIAGGEWYVVDRDGGHVATVRVPDGLEPLQVSGGRVLALSADELGVQRVTVHDIVMITGA